MIRIRSLPAYQVFEGWAGVCAGLSPSLPCEFDAGQPVLAVVATSHAAAQHAADSQAAGRLQEQGLIRYRRGHISVLDRAGLEQDVCECYAVVKKEFARLLSDVRQRQDGITS